MGQGAVALRLNLCHLSSRNENLPGAEERAKRETAEREKQLLEERCKEMQQKIKLLEIMFNKSIIQLKAEMMIETENLLRKRDEKIQRLEVSPAWDPAETAEQSLEAPRREW